MPSPGQSNSKERGNKNLQKDIQHPFDTIQILLEQSKPCLPASQEHSPEVRSHWPCPSQGLSPPGHGISKKKQFSILFYIFYRLFLPWHISPSNPSVQRQVPLDSSHVPWFEQSPSPGQSNSVGNKFVGELYCFCIVLVLNRYLLEQSMPCLPEKHEHSPVDVPQFPALLQSSGHVNSRILIYQKIVTCDK